MIATGENRTPFAETMLTPSQTRTLIRPKASPTGISLWPRTSGWKGGNRSRLARPRLSPVSISCALFKSE